MLNGAGKKIILWSKILLFAGIALSVVIGFVIIWRGTLLHPLRITVYHTSYLYKAGVLDGSRFIVAGILVMIFGSLASWLTALLLRAFGDLSIDTKAIRERLEAEPAATATEEPAEEKPVKPVRKKTANPQRLRREKLESPTGNDTKTLETPIPPCYNIRVRGNARKRKTMTETKARTNAVCREEGKRCKLSIPLAENSLQSRFAERIASKRSRGSAHPVIKREHFPAWGDGIWVVQRGNMPSSHAVAWAKAF
ncbi:MAG: hypothetical protein JW811_05185 [Clostridiales bacterium]|nr:hypothetical protein [Clostridiales bacterium]